MERGIWTKCEKNCSLFYKHYWLLFQLCVLWLCPEILRRTSLDERHNYPPLVCHFTTTQRGPCSNAHWIHLSDRSRGFSSSAWKSPSCVPHSWGSYRRHSLPRLWSFDWRLCSSSLETIIAHMVSNQRAKPEYFLQLSHAVSHQVLYIFLFRNFTLISIPGDPRCHEGSPRSLCHCGVLNLTSTNVGYPAS